MNPILLRVAIALATTSLVASAVAATKPPQADFLFIGSYHMGNPGRDVHNTRSDDVLGEKRQKQIAEVARLLERYRPTKVVVEVGAGKQEAISKRFAESCKGVRPLEGDEVEQLGFRIACASGLETVIAVDWNEMGPFTNEDSVDYRAAVERHGQQGQYEAHLAIGKANADNAQQILDRGTVLDMLKHMNSTAYLQQNAMAYHRIAMLGTPADPVGANWMQLWFGRNLTIFNRIARNTGAGDRILVIYGAGHGNMLRQMAADSGLYQVHDPLDWLSTQPKQGSSK